MIKSTPISRNFVRPRDMTCGDNRMHGITGGRNHKVGFVTTLRFQCTYALMMTSSNGNIFRVTGPLCGEFTGPGELPTQRPVTRSFDVYFDLRLNKRLCKQSWGWWFETLLCPLWRHSNASSWAANWTPGTRVSWRDILLRVLPKCCWDITTSANSLCHGPLARYVKLRVAHVPRMPGTLPPPPRVSDPDMLHGTWVTHVPRCMPGSLICGFLWSRWRENVPGIPAHAQPAILRIWQKAHGTCPAGFTISRVCAQFVSPS